MRGSVCWRSSVGDKRCTWEFWGLFGPYSSSGVFPICIGKRGELRWFRSVWGVRYSAGNEYNGMDYTTRLDQAVCGRHIVFDPGLVLEFVKASTRGRACGPPGAKRKQKRGTGSSRLTMFRLDPVRDARRTPGPSSQPPTPSPGPRPRPSDLQTHPPSSHPQPPPPNPPHPAPVSPPSPHPPSPRPRPPPPTRPSAPTPTH